MSEPTKNMLIVEDEPLIRMCAVEFAEDAGFLAIEASDAESALRMLADRPDVSLLFTDINLPGPLDGVELAERAARDYPRLKILISSGKPPPTTRIAAPTAFLPKPYDAAQWQSAIEALTG